MAKTDSKVAPTVETLKPYLDRALSDKEFREDLKEALSAARKLYGPLVKDAKDDGAAKSASRLATDAKVQENLRNALEEFGKAAGSPEGQEEEEPQGPERDAARRPHRRCALQPVVGPADARVADGQGRRRRRPPAARRLRPRCERPTTGVRDVERRRRGGQSSRSTQPRRSEACASALAVAPPGRALRSPAGEGRLECARHEPARARDVRRLEQHGAGRRRDAAARPRQVRRAAGRRGRRRTRRPPHAATRSGTGRARSRRRIRRASSETGWISKWRWDGENSASPVLPMKPTTSPALTWRPLTASGE